MITADLVYFRHGPYLSTLNDDGSPMTAPRREAAKRAWIRTIRARSRGRLLPGVRRPRLRA
jgi:hypothetical protein